MPVTVQEGALLGTGMMMVSGAALFYRQKKTTPFKIAYFLSWPVLGAGIINAFGPDTKKMEQELKANGLNTEQIEANRKHIAMQMQALKHTAEDTSSAWSEGSTRR